MTLHPQIIEKDGKKEFVVLSYEEFLQIEEALEDFEDLKELRKEKEESKGQPTTPLDKAAKELNL
ncbi:MAG: prevent-host-death family protein [Candidatus Brocadia sp. UTAMX2]|jgi:PHD/YefM family antitoxin component YafN of YafNO toxin-antitoxin module|nr:MAG: prevent-host-death family protein [Candidatus Brocadia sp. UTAMX2]